MFRWLPAEPRHSTTLRETSAPRGASLRASRSSERPDRRVMVKSVRRDRLPRLTRYLSAGRGDHLDRFHAEIAHASHVCALDLGLRFGLVADACANGRFDLDLAVALVRRFALHLDAVTNVLRQIVVGDERVPQASPAVGQDVAATRVALQASADFDLFAVLHFDLGFRFSRTGLRAQADRTHRRHTKRCTDEFHEYLSIPIVATRHRSRCAVLNMFAMSDAGEGQAARWAAPADDGGWSRRIRSC